MGGSVDGWVGGWVGERRQVPFVSFRATQALFLLLAAEFLSFSCIFYVLAVVHIIALLFLGARH